MATATKSIPFVVPAQPIPAVEPISQTELALFVSLPSRVAQLQKQIDEQETALTARLESGAGIEPGIHVAELKESSRRNVSWKSIVQRLAGERYAKRVLAATRPDRSLNLVVN